MSAEGDCKTAPATPGLLTIAVLLRKKALDRLIHGQVILDLGISLESYLEYVDINPYRREN